MVISTLYKHAAGDSSPVGDGAFGVLFGDDRNDSFAATSKVNRREPEKVRGNSRHKISAYKEAREDGTVRAWLRSQHGASINVCSKTHAGAVGPSL